MKRTPLKMFICGVFFALVILAGVLASGSTFGQRCERMYPAEPQRAAICVDNLAAGRPS